jgi:hypothetical protein
MEQGVEGLYNVPNACTLPYISLRARDKGRQSPQVFALRVSPSERLRQRKFGLDGNRQDSDFLTAKRKSPRRWLTASVVLLSSWR